MGPVAKEVSRRLSETFQPTALVVRDDSEQHRGHAGHREGVETHFTVEICAAAFAGRSRVERQRMVYAALSDLMNNPIHALSLKITTPEG
ncbi:BolA family protein [Pedomonas mirosovicensis]|uniref:BolA family protein n=1 Tax=Pedomonas mirosovicensis TaxID=2908641 RepID=UPI00216A8C5B|nr:BolA family protein [Pedomonas mirosovicensis]MCH8683856.1 BolA family transcriptional regulator [Pedomonas mirosovicensis]